MQNLGEIPARSGKVGAHVVAASSEWSHRARVGWEQRRSVSVSLGSDIVAPVLVALVVAGGGIYLSPLRHKISEYRLRQTGDHGVKVVVYSTADEMVQLPRPTMLWVEPSWVADVDFYFANGIPAHSAPPRERQEWPDWARGQGGEVVGWQHIFVLLQATQDRAVVLRTLKVNSSTTPAAGGLVLSPVKQLGGNGLMVRQFAIELDARPPTVEFYPEGEPQVPDFTLKRGDSVGFFLVVHARKGRHEWTLDLPMVIDGELFHERISNHGRPFVTVGHEDLEGMWWDFDSRTWREPDW